MAISRATVGRSAVASDSHFRSRFRRMYDYTPLLAGRIQALMRIVSRWGPVVPSNRDRRHSSCVDSFSKQPSELVARIMAGDQAAEAALVQRYTRGVRVVLSKSKDPALIDDIFQDTFLLVLVKIREGQLNEPSKLAAFIVSVANNLLIEHYRKNKRRKTDSDSEMISRVAAESSGPYAHVEREDLMMLLRDSISELPMERDRTFLSRYFFEFADKAQLCDELDVSPAHFDRLKYRALQRLRALVRERGGL